VGDHRSQQGERGHPLVRGGKRHSGFKVGHLEKKLGIRSSETAELILDDCVIPLENMIGDENDLKTKGFKGVMATFDATRPGVAAMAVGIARAALEYLEERLREEGWKVRVMDVRAEIFPPSTMRSWRWNRRSKRRAC